MGRVIVFGSANQDLHLEMERHPTSGETLMAGDLEQLFGGKGGNQAIAAALAGGETHFIGMVGDDAAGAEYRRRLDAFGVNTSALATSPDRPTGTAIIHVDATGENMIVVAPGANHAVGADQIAALDMIEPGDIFLAQLELPLEVTFEAARKAHAKGARVIINAAPYATLPADVLEFCDPLIVNEHEAALMAADGLTAPSLLVTRGMAGSQWGEVTAAAVPTKAVDTTGAGDSFCGTLAAELARGAAPADAMAAASLASSRSVEHHGAQPPVPEV